MMKNKKITLLLGLFAGVIITSFFFISKFSPVKTADPAPTPSVSHLMDGQKVQGKTGEDKTKIEIFQDETQLKILSLEDIKALAVPPQDTPKKLRKQSLVKVFDMLKSQNVTTGQSIEILGYLGEKTSYPFAEVTSGKQSLVLISTFVPAWKLAILNDERSLGGVEGGFIIRAVKRITIKTNDRPSENDEQIANSYNCKNTKVYTSIADALREADSVCIVSLPNQSLSGLPEEFTTLKNIKVLNLGHNNFTQIPNVILRLSTLIELNMSGNNLTQIPDLSPLSNLITLKLGRNKITAVPATISSLQKLKKIELDNNLVSTLPPEIGQLSSLEDFEFAYNKLTTLPKEVENLKNVIEVDLKENPISEEEKTKIKSYFPQAEVEF